MMRKLITALCACVMTACSPPPPEYVTTKLVTERRDTLYENLLRLLPEKQCREGAAREEARWLADTAYKAAAGISRVNDSRFPGWIGNFFINARQQDRGLCWHYQHDMFRELRRRHLEYYRIGCCVRDRGHSSEHNCVYIAAKGAEWPHGWMLDAWKYNGRLRVSNCEELDPDDWEELEDVQQVLEGIYPEEHKLPIEHWFSIRSRRGMNKYISSYSDEARQSSQYSRMLRNIQRGREEHPGKLTNY